MSPRFAGKTKAPPKMADSATLSLNLPPQLGRTFPSRPLPPRSADAATRKGPGFVWWYETIIDEMIANPHQSLGEISQKLGRTQTWVSLVIHSDSFKARYEERRSEHSARLSDAIHSKASAVVLKGMDVLLEKLENPAALATGAVLEVVDRTLERLGYGAKVPIGVSVNAPGSNVIVVGATVAELESARSKIKQLEQSRLLAAEGGGQQSRSAQAQEIEGELLSATVVESSP